MKLLHLMHQLMISAQTMRRVAAHCGADSHSQRECYVAANHSAQPMLSALRGRSQNRQLMIGAKV